MKDFAGLWREASNLLPKIFKKIWVWSVFATILSEIGQLIGAQIREMDDRFLLIAALVPLTVYAITWTLGTIIICQAAYNAKYGSKLSVWESIEQNFKYVLIESTRALLPVLLKGLLLIFPGLIEGLRLYFVSLVVMFDPEYKAGKIDALERSRELARGRIPQMIAVLLLPFVLGILPSYWLYKLQLLKSPAAYVVAFVLVMMTDLYSSCVLFCLYDHYRGRQNDNSISLQGSARP